MNLRRSKIVVTLGPASQKKEDLKKILLAGADILRFNFSHGDHQQHLKNLQVARNLFKELDVAIPIIADLQGPKIRLGEIIDGHISVERGETITLTNDKNAKGENNRFYLSYKTLAQDVLMGDHILIDDGKFRFEVSEVNGTEVVLKAHNGGNIYPKKGVNLPNTKISLPCLTEKDLQDLDFALEHDFEFIALSFVRKASDVEELRSIIDERKSSSKIISKIEKPGAIEDIESIIKKSDAIMVARGDLGVEIPYHQVPIVQKKIAGICLDNSKPFIIATQVMESMIENPAPTRAEVSDAANSLYDGADAIMLSGETSVGKYATNVVEYLANIIYNVENNEKFKIVPRKRFIDENEKRFVTNAICKSACRLSENINAKGIVTMTNSGYTAFEVSSYRPGSFIFVFTDNRHVMATLNIIRGVKTFYYDKYKSTDNTITEINDILKESGIVTTGDFLINLASVPIQERGMVNILKLSKVE